MVVTQIWQGYAACLFLSFGKLTAADYKLPNSRPGRAHGELELTTMDSFSDWTLTLGDTVLATSESRRRLREIRLQRLVGRRLLSVQIAEPDRSTILAFSGGLALTTNPDQRYRERRPHWLLRLSKDDWPSVILSGTSSRWRGKSTCD
jgi:hypothetical protein